MILTHLLKTVVKEDGHSLPGFNLTVVCESHLGNIIKKIVAPKMIFTLMCPRYLVKDIACTINTVFPASFLTTVG